MITALLRKVTLICLITISFTSCKKEASIQTYFVEHQELPNFTFIDVSPKMIALSTVEFTEEQKDTYNSLEKINFLGYRIKDEDLTAYNNELTNIQNVFKNRNYYELMSFSTNGIKFRINAEGTQDVVNEVLVLASTEDKGFGVVRLLGDNMKPESIIKLIRKLQKADIDKKQLDGILNFFN